MPNLFLTLMIAFVVIVIAIACLAIGWLLTGKTKLEKACGRDPTKNRDGSCNISSDCTLCSPNDKNHSTNKNIETESNNKESMQK